MDPSRGRLADVDRRSGAASEPSKPPAVAPREPRQRWRITFARAPVAADQVGRVAIEAWQRALAGSGLQVAGLDDAGPRPRIALAAPLQAAARGEREMIEVWLLDRRPLWALREAIQPRLPERHAWVDAEDVWLGAPALAGQVAAADWRIELDGVPPDPEGSRRIRSATIALDEARTIPRVRLKGTVEKVYDLRPLLASVDVDRQDGQAAPVLVVRTRFHPELGSGRPEEVVAALAEASGLVLGARSITRTRLILADELRRPAAG